MTMKLMNLLKEDEVDYQPLNDLKFKRIPFEYGDVCLQYGYEIYGKSNDTTLPISIRLNKFEPDMFDKAYLAYAQKIKSLFGDKFNLENIKLKIDESRGRMSDVFDMDLNPFLSVNTKNTLRYDKPPVKQILYYGYGVDVDMDLLPHVTDDTYDIIKKKREHGKNVFEFLEDGTLSNGTSYKLIFQDLGVGHHSKESSGRHLDYSDFYLLLDVKIDKDFPLDREEKGEIKRMFRMYDVELDFIIS